LLSEKDRELAPSFYQGLLLGQECLLGGASLEETKRKVKAFFDQKELRFDYFEVVDSNNLEVVQDITRHETVSLCIAGYIKSVRLIDNIFLYP